MICVTRLFYNKSLLPNRNMMNALQWINQSIASAMFQEEF